MGISTKEISEVIKERLKDFDASLVATDVGRIVATSDGIAQIYGLQNAMAGELLEFPHDTYGLALNLEEDQVRAVILGDYGHLHEGDEVRTTGRLLEVPVGDELIGRVVNPLGQPLDGKGPIKTTKTMPIERIAPGVITRKRVDSPVQTGIKAIDAMIPIGRGQRELIIGDRFTGKTTVLLDTIINQKGKDLICVYVAIGQNAASIARATATLEENGAMDYTIIVAATASDAASLNFIAPVRGLRDGRVLHGAGQGSPLLLRRPHQAGVGVSRALAQPAPPAGTRGVSRRRLLPALETARARREDEPGQRRRLADRAAGDRDAGERRLGLHPDQRDLHHRRPDLPAGRPVQRRPAAGAQRRHQRLARRWRRPDQGHAPGRRPAAPRPRPVPRAGRLRAVRLRPRHRRRATSSSVARA